MKYVCVCKCEHTCMHMCVHVYASMGVFQWEGRAFLKPLSESRSLGKEPVSLRNWKKSVWLPEVRPRRKWGARSPKASEIRLSSLAFVLKVIGSYWRFLSLKVTGSDLHFRKIMLTAVFSKDDEKAKPSQGDQDCMEVDLTVIMGKGRCSKQ